MCSSAWGLETRRPMWSFTRYVCPGIRNRRRALGCGESRRLSLSARVSRIIFFFCPRAFHQVPEKGRERTKKEDTSPMTARRRNESSFFRCENEGNSSTSVPASMVLFSSPKCPLFLLPLFPSHSGVYIHRTSMTPPEAWWAWHAVVSRSDSVPPL